MFSSYLAIKAAAASDLRAGRLEMISLARRAIGFDAARERAHNARLRVRALFRVTASS